MLTLQGVTYAHPNKDVLFSGINFFVNRHDKITLTGNNGTGKSTLLKIMAGMLPVSAGVVKANTKPYYVPQLAAQHKNTTVAQALQVHDKLTALQNILSGDASVENLALLNDDWNIEERCNEAFAHWRLDDIKLTRQMETLSGGQKTKIFLAGIMVHQPEIVLLDEPSNHLDTQGRQTLYKYLTTTNNTLVVVSHDRSLLNLLDTVCELNSNGIAVYGGNYDFYAEQKQIEAEALNADVKHATKELRKAKEIERATMEREQKLDARGKKKQLKAGLPTISMNTFRNNAEKSTARVKNMHAEKLSGLTRELNQLRLQLPPADKMRMGFYDTTLHKGKVVISATAINAGYGQTLLWQQPLSFDILSGERIAIKGPNGSGKTTLLKILLGDLPPKTGVMQRAAATCLYIDQDYSLLNNNLTVYQQAEMFNDGALQQHEINIRLNRFLFNKAFWDKPCSTLSGGERMRLVLCCLTIQRSAPDIIVLDEPTNNLDIQNIEILTAAISDYKGTLLVVSHDEYFLNEINMQRVIALV